LCTRAPQKAGDICLRLFEAAIFLEVRLLGEEKKQPSDFPAKPSQPDSLRAADLAVPPGSTRPISVIDPKTVNRPSVEHRKRPDNAKAATHMLRCLREPSSKTQITARKLVA